MAVPPILVLTGVGIYTIIAGISPILSSAGTALTSGIGIAVALAGMPFSVAATVGALMHTTLFPVLAAFGL